MSISVISFSLDSSKESVGTSTGRVILFGTIPTTIPDTTPSVIPPTTHIDTIPIPTVSPTIPPSPDYTPASPDYSPASNTKFDPSEDPSSDHIPPLPATSPFLSSTDDPSDSDIPDTPPSPTHGTPFTETTLSTQRSPVASGALRRRVMVLAPGQPIPHGRPYRYHLNGPTHMMTARKRVGPLPTHRLAMRHLVDYSSSDHFSSKDSSRDSSSSSSSETSSDSSADALSDSASSRSSFDHSSPTPSSGMRPSHHLCSLVSSIHHSSVAISERPSHDSSSASPSRKRSRSPTASVPLSSPILGALSYARADLLPSPKRIRSLETATDLEGCLEDRTNLEMDVDVVRSDGIDINPEIQEIETSMRGLVEVRVDRVTHPVVAEDILEPAQEGAVEVTYETLGDLVQRFHDHMEEIPVCRVQVIESVQRDQGHRIVATGQQSADMLERIRELEWDNMRLRDMMDVVSQRVARSQRRELRVQREMRQIWRFRFYDRMRIARLEACARRHLGYLIMILTMPNTRSGASRTREGINEQIDRQMAGALGARTTARNLEPLMRDGGGQEEVNGNGGNRNGGNGNGGNGNGGNGNGGNRNGGNGNGNGNGGGNGYNFGGFVPARECTYQDFLKCQPLSFNGTEGVVGLTRWFEKMETVFHISNCLERYQVKYASCTLLNSALTWWNSYKRTIRIEAAYAMSWAELMKLMTEVYCPRNEVQKMETELWNLVVKGNDLTAYTRRFQELVLLCTRMVPNEEDKVKRFVGGLPDNIQGNVIAAEPTKLQDAIRVANNLMDQKLKGYARSAENKRRLDNNPRDNRGQQPVFKRQNVKVQNVARAYTAGNNEKKRDYTTTVNPNTQRAPVRSQLGIVCYECGRPGHFRKDFPKLRNQNRGNKTRSKSENKTGNQTGCNEATTKAYAIGGGGANPDSNVVTGTFLLNNCYASMLFDSGANRSFVSSTFSALLDVTPSTLDTSYAVKLADKRISETNVVLRGCTLGLLGHPFDIDLMPVELGSFDVIIGMDWLVKYHALIVCDEKVVRIPYGDKVLIIRGDDCDCGKVRGKTFQECNLETRYGQLRSSKVIRFCLINAPTIFMDLMNQVCKSYLDRFVIVFIDDILVYSKSRKEHEGHLKLIMRLLKKEELYAKEGIHVNPAKIESIKDWASPKTPTEIQKAKAAFQLLKQKLCSAPILALPEGSENFVVYCDASHKGLSIILMQKDKVIAYASRQLKVHEKNYTTHDLELGARSVCS
ncbi:putative reverse transcriptase domain-containing protein [Tanacetum coccineum]